MRKKLVRINLRKNPSLALKSNFGLKFEARESEQRAEKFPDYKWRQNLTRKIHSGKKNLVEVKVFATPAAHFGFVKLKPCGFMNLSYGQRL